jgi:hypothetical protein
MFQMRQIYGCSQVESTDTMRSFNSASVRTGGVMAVARTQHYSTCLTLIPVALRKHVRVVAVALRDAIHCSTRTWELPNVAY